MRLELVGIFPISPFVAWSEEPVEIHWPSFTGQFSRRPFDHETDDPESPTPIQPNTITQRLDEDFPVAA